MKKTRFYHTAIIPILTRGEIEAENERTRERLRRLDSKFDQVNKFDSEDRIALFEIETAVNS